MIDPFGITGLPFRLIERLLANPRCEVLVTFMNVTIQRFVTELPGQTDELIGQAGAADVIAAFPSADRRVGVARKLYEESLRRVARFVRFFEMRDRKDRQIYDLFFATNHDLGHLRMKEAMWKLDSTGEFSFSDGVDPAQVTLFSPHPERDLVHVLWARFRSDTAYTDEILEFTCNETPFLEKHCRSALKLLEQEGGFGGRQIRVEELKRDGSRRRLKTYPKGLRITFEGT